MFKNDLLLRYRPEHNLNLKYKINYNMTGDRDGARILDTSLELLSSYKVIGSSGRKNKSVSMTLDEATFISNNTLKKVPYKGEKVLFTFDELGRMVDRKSNIPAGFLDFLHFTFPADNVNIGSQWDSVCHAVFPNIKSPVEITGLFNFLIFKTFKAYNCIHISFSFNPRIIPLTSGYNQTLSGNGYIFFDNTYSIITFMAIDTIVNTGDLGLVFKASLKKEIGPFSGGDPSSDMVSSPDEYFISRY